MPSPAVLKDRPARQDATCIFLLACKKIHVTPQRAYAIEDSYNGITAAYRGGLMPIMVPDLLPATDKMQVMAQVKENLLDVMEYFDN